MVPFSSYCNIARSFARYWNAYGGWCSFFQSPYVHTSAVLAFLLYRFSPNIDVLTKEVFKLTISITPSILGFTLAGLTVFLGVGDEKFRNAIRGKRQNSKTESPFLSVIATFVHFCVIHGLSLLNAIIGGTLFKTCLPFFYKITSIWLFVYSLLLIFASIMAVFFLAVLYDKAKQPEDDSQAKQFRVTVKKID